MTNLRHRGRTKTNGLVNFDPGHTVQQTDPCLWPFVFVAGVQGFLWFSSQPLRGALEQEDSLGMLTKLVQVLSSTSLVLKQGTSTLRA